MQRQPLIYGSLDGNDPTFIVIGVFSTEVEGLELIRRRFQFNCGLLGSIWLLSHRVAMEIYATLCVGGPDTTVEVKAAVLQNAVVLDPCFFDFVYFMKQSKTLWVFHSQRGKIRVVSGHIHPHVILCDRVNGFLQSIQPSFHLLIWCGTEKVRSVTRQRAALKHKRFSQRQIRSNLCSFQLYCQQSLSFAFIPFVPMVMKAAVMSEHKPPLPPAFNESRLSALVKIASTSWSWGVRTSGNVWSNGQC